MSAQTVKNVSALKRNISEVDGDNEAFLEEAVMGDDYEEEEEDEETFLPVTNRSTNRIKHY